MYDFWSSDKEQQKEIDNMAICEGCEEFHHCMFIEKKVNCEKLEDDQPMAKVTDLTKVIIEKKKDKLIQQLKDKGF